MVIFLMAAAQSMAPAETPKCHHLNPSRVASFVKQIDDVMYLSQNRTLAGVSELADYWRGTCAEERATAPKSTVTALSSLLSSGIGMWAVASMLLDVGPNLSAARDDVDAAIWTQTIREDAAMKASAPIMPESGIGLADLLRCVRHKMDTGKVDPQLCYRFGIGPSY